MLKQSTSIKGKFILTFQNLDCKVDARLLVLVHVVLKLRLAKLVEGDDDQGDEDVVEEERKDEEEDDVEDALLQKNCSIIFQRLFGIFPKIHPIW